MKLNKIRSAAIVAMALTLTMSMTSLADWQYTLYGPIAVWTNTVTGEQTTVYAGQPAPDGTAAPQLTLAAQITTESDTASAIAAANAAVDAAKAARGGNVASGTGLLTSAQMAANTAAANANTNTNTVAVINGSTSSSKSTYSNAELPTIPTSDQTAANTTGIADGTYVGPGNSVSKRISGGTASINSGTYSYQKSAGHLVTNAESPEVKVASSTNTTTGTTTTSGTTAGTTTGTTTTGTTAGTVAASAENYTGTLPSTGDNNVSTYSTPGATS